MAVNFTPDQQKAINATGTVLVSAAAGSGKTAVLTERVVKLLADENKKISADRLLIVTFTNASALEMRVRINKRLDELCKEAPGNTYLMKQKLLLKGAKICTIDAFCIELVRSHFAVLGINPDFSVAEPSQTDLIREQSLNTVLSKRYTEKSDSFNSLSLLFGYDKTEKELSEAVYKIHDYSMCMSQPQLWLNSAADGYSCSSLDDCVFVPVILEHVIEILCSEGDTVSFLLREIAGSSIEYAYVDGLNEAYENINALISLAKQGLWDELYDGLLNFKINIGRVTKTSDVRLKEVVMSKRKSVVTKINSLADKMIGPSAVVLNGLKQTKPIVGELIDIVKEFSSVYFEMLCKRNLLTFSHIEQLALKLLCEEKDGILVPSKLSEEIYKNFDEVLVDEYQDNNNLQDALFFALSGGNHLFMVGDVKQSIYGFRNANPDNFLKHKDEYPLYDGTSSPSKVILKANFRSRSGVCDFVNAFCNTVMKRSTCGMDYTEEEELVASAVYSESCTPDVGIFLNETKYSGIKREQVDAEKIAEYIEKTVNSEPFLRDGDGVRRAEYRDFAILLRSPGTRAKYYIDALKKKGIPAAYSTGEFYESPEVLTAISMLKVIDNPTHDIPLLSVMMSVMFSFTPDDLAVLRSEHKKGSLYASVCAAANSGDERCRYFVETLSKLRFDAATMSVSRLLNEIYLITSLPEIMSARDDCKQSRNNLLRLVTLAAKFESVNSSGISGFVADFERLSVSSKNSGSVVGNNENAVKIISFHGSKGLQFPICIVADCGGLFNMTDVKGKMILNEAHGIGLKFVDAKNNVRATSIAREALSVLQLKKLISEEIRLFYVALTRAEERLIISLSIKDVENKILDAAGTLGFYGLVMGTAPSPTVISAEGYYSWVLLTALLQSDGDKICSYADVEPIGFNGKSRFFTEFSQTVVADEEQFDVENVEYSLPDACNNGCDSNAEEIMSSIKQRLEFKYPYGHLSRIPSKMAVTELVHGDSNKFSFTARPEFLSKSGLTPAERGTAAHKFMQYADYSNAEKDIASEVERLKEWEFLSEAEADSLEHEKLSKFFNSSVFDRIKNAVAVHREYKFMVEYPYDNETTIVQGIADCIFEENDGIVILDFKTDRINDLNELKGAYAEQLSVYKFAIEKIFNKKVKETILYSLHLNAEVIC